jgi:hypothetical protein
VEPGRTLRPAGSKTSAAASQPGLITAGEACCRSAKPGPTKHAMRPDMQHVVGLLALGPDNPEHREMWRLIGTLLNGAR